MTEPESTARQIAVASTAGIPAAAAASGPPAPAAPADSVSSGLATTTATGKSATVRGRSSPAPNSSGGNFLRTVTTTAGSPVRRPATRRNPGLIPTTLGFANNAAPLASIAANTAANRA